jgi:predicted nuclease of predicted toxin-antitoxin system
VKIVADENIDIRVIEILREFGHDIISIRERERGSIDPVVLFLANLNNALLITEDKDFGDLVYQKRQPHFGVLLIRVQQLTRPTRIQAVCNAISTYGDSLTQTFSVLTPGGLRIRSSKEANSE